MKNVFFSLAALLLASGCTSLFRKEPPESWNASYQRFENYLARRHEFVPTWSYQVSDTGKIHREALPPQTRKRYAGYSFRYYRSGAIAHHKTSLDTGLPEGRYLLTVRGVGPYGYQHAEPLVEVKVVSDSPHSREIRFVRELKESDEEFPNLQTLRFQDFHAFPKTHIFEIYKGNQKVPTPIFLQVSETPEIHKTFSHGDHLLKRVDFLIYQNGTRIQREPLSRKPTLVSGPGWYQAMVVLEGPSGDMMVSNLLQFYIHNDGTETGSLIPEDSDNDSIPDYIENLYGMNPQAPADANEDTDGDGLSNLFEIRSRHLIPTKPIQEEPWFYTQPDPEL